VPRPANPKATSHLGAHYLSYSKLEKVLVAQVRRHTIKPHLIGPRDHSIESRWSPLNPFQLISNPEFSRPSCTPQRKLERAWCVSA
jgi:hypothetical protein